MNNPKNKHSSYHYYREQQIKFFPKKNILEFGDVNSKQLDIDGKIVEIEIDKLYPDNFYTRKTISLKDSKNSNIFDFVDS